MIEERKPPFKKLTFEKMCEISPALARLRKDAVKELADDDDPDFWERYEALKSQLAGLVGFYAIRQPEFMTTQEAYDIAHKAIFSELV